MISRVLMCVFFITLAVTTSSTSVSQEGDSIAATLDSARTKFLADVELARNSLISEIEKKSEAAQRSGDLAAFEKLEMEKKAFITDNVIPNWTAKKTYESAMRKARSQVEDAFSSAIRAYTKAGNFEQARIVRSELERFVREEGSTVKPNPQTGLWVHKSGYFLRGLDGDWFEKWDDGNRPANLLKQISATSDFIELKNYFSSIHVRIYADKVMFKDLKKGDTEFSEIYRGSWKPLKND